MFPIHRGTAHIGCKSKSEILIGQTQIVHRGLTWFGFPLPVAATANSAARPVCQPNQQKHWPQGRSGLGGIWDKAVCSQKNDCIYYLQNCKSDCCAKNYHKHIPYVYIYIYIYVYVYIYTFSR